LTCLNPTDVSRANYMFCLCPFFDAVKSIPQVWT